MEKLEELIEKIVRRIMAEQSFTATVKSVDKESNTCTVETSGGIEKFDVRLTPVVGPGEVSWILYPKTGSLVTCSILYNDERNCFISQYGELEEIVFSSGENGAILKTDSFLEELEKLKETTDAIVDVLSGTPVNEPGNGSPSALQAALRVKLEGKSTGDFKSVQDKRIKL